MNKELTDREYKEEGYGQILWNRRFPREGRRGADC